jgi:Predicted periplasmic protein (DUF2092)
MVRDIGVVARTERDDAHRDLYFDGETFTISLPNGNVYASTPFKGRFEVLVEIVTQPADAVLPMWSIMSRDLPEQLVEGAEDTVYLGVKLIDDRPAHHVAFVADHQDWQVWISTDPDAPVPLNDLDEYRCEGLAAVARAFCRLDVSGRSGPRAVCVRAGRGRCLGWGAEAEPSGRHP